MEFTSRESVHALKQAQLREQEAYERYQRALDEAKIEGTRNVLALLVADEKRHYQIVTSFINDAEKGIEPSEVDMTEQPSAKERLDQAFSHSGEIKERLDAENASTIELLEKAKEAEKESFDLYSKLAGETENNETVSVYRYLAREENRHYVMVDNLLDFVGDPGNWLYEE